MTQNFMKNFRKISWAASEKFKDERTNRQTKQETEKGDY